MSSAVKSSCIIKICFNENKFVDRVDRVFIINAKLKSNKRGLKPICSGKFSQKSGVGIWKPNDPVVVV